MSDSEMGEAPFAKLERLFAGEKKAKNAGKKLPNRLENKTHQDDNFNKMITNEVDPKFLFNISQELVRIEYPGNVKNVERAIETLGGLDGIQKAVDGHRNKLELRFHPENIYNKPCMAEKDMNPGILLKVTVKSPEEQPGTSRQAYSAPAGPQYTYEVVGATVLNFKFNRICDFQYLPLVADGPETEESEVEYVYDKILPDNLPDMAWFVNEELKNAKKFFLPAVFSRMEVSSNKLYLNTGEKFGSIRPEITNFSQCINREKSRYVSTKQISVFVDFQKPNIQVPSQPLTYTMELVKERCLIAKYQAVLKLFEERPIWTKAAVRYKTGLSYDHAKMILPAVSYFCVKGPWRMTWIKFDYNPQKDFNSRIYQTLDYRIRTGEGTVLKVNAKRNYASKTIFYLPPADIKKISLMDSLSNYKKDAIEERSFVLKSTTIPPARQMFYQYCDILIPEIQNMISRLPKMSASAKCDLKNGWLPDNFTEQCREIVNTYVMQSVQEELLKDSISQETMAEEVVKEKEVPTYCSEMLNNIKRGIYKSFGVPGESPSASSSKPKLTKQEIIDTIDLADEEMEDINAGDVISQSIPERLEENSDDEMSQSSDLVIDLEVVEEVNQMIADIDDDDEINDVTKYLKTTM